MRHFARYTVVGAFATLVHYALLTLVVELAHWPAYLGSGFGAVVGAQVAFFGNRWFTFAHGGEVAPAWVKFQSTALAGALLGMGVVGLGVRWGLHYLAAQVLATLASLVLTFAINRAWTFR
ncbi:GtrA family protein [Piscinibacter sp.]|jgi:putative flippase GtrA|uniref:GtrA family protein n=1 Tax=Piscinibacter sp. TaxID=1903157 RepID=UPI0035599201